ncbi:MAG: efflux RND transporter periplasmic adaptor subunit [Myxococcota bacterium]
MTAPARFFSKSSTAGRRIPARLLVTSAMACAICVGPLLLGGCDDAESTQLDKKVLPHVRAAEVRLIEPRPRSRHLAPLEPHRRARLSPRTGGQVLVLNADEEQEVKQGTVLVRFAAQDSKGGLISAKASIVQIEESLRDTRRELEDANDLVRKGAGTTREVERLETQQATLKAQLRNAKGTLVQAKDRVGAATLSAPFDGTITAVQTEVGEFIAPGVVAVVLAELDPISVEVPLTQTEAAMYDDQGGLTFVVKARGEKLEASVEYVSSESADGATFTARLEVPNTDKSLRGGELVDVEVFGKAQGRVRAVPFTAVRWAADQAYLLVVNPDSTLKRVDITVVDEADEEVIIDGEIEAGARVVETGPTALRDGDTVEVVAAPGDTLASG